ncbi:hypothetical protein SHIRM173S_00101 [Streptomyces hirsutus]
MSPKPDPTTRTSQPSPQPNPGALGAAAQIRGRNSTSRTVDGKITALGQPSVEFKYAIPARGSAPLRR